MQHQVDQVVPTRLVRAERLAVEHVRQPPDRMPVRLLTGNQSPSQILDIQPLLNVLIFSYVSVVIGVDVPVVTDLSVYTDRAEEQDQNNDRVTAY